MKGIIAIIEENIGEGPWVKTFPNKTKAKAYVEKNYKGMASVQTGKSVWKELEAKGIFKDGEITIRME